MDSTSESILESSLFKDDIDIKVLDARENIITNGKNSRIQFNPFIYFYFLAEGSGTFFIESDAVKIKKNDLVIINSNIGHNIFVDENEYACRSIGFGVESIGINTVKEEINNNKADEKIDSNKDPNSLDESEDEEKIKLEIDNYILIPCKEEGKRVYEIFSSIVEEFSSDDLYARTLADSMASYFIIKLLRLLKGKIEIVHDVNINRQVDYIKSYIDGNYSTDIKLEELSSLAYMNKFHLIAEFKQAYRVTPIEYLILKRVEVSKGLLISTNHSMETIAHIVGFNSQSYFNQVFRKKVGFTPSQFRKKHRL
ncbi:helix-turn-helix domain-containing protein [Anaerococcus vaginimassiliensis]|uniref:helix-turn-helix domain-containing protein n=1 Tax=Anaerococcus vaginimassiliensis TaxID=2042308 RepID=UPI001030EB5F|nr:AraC family transcriptional regulator [Anaerococcus vaginimassiliensis]